MEAPSLDNRSLPEVARFRVGIELPGVRGGGTLSVRRGAIVLKTDRVTQALSRVDRVVHTDPNVVIVTAWLIPPWFNTSVALHGDGGWARATTWVGGRRALRDALIKAGFNVREATTRLSRDAFGEERPSPALGGTRPPWWTRRGARAVSAIASIPIALVMVLLFSRSPGFIALMAVIVALNFAAIFWPGAP